MRTMPVIYSGRRSAILRIGLILLLAAFCIALAAGAPTTQIHVVRYAGDGTTILDEETITYQDMEATLPVWGDGITHYYAQGPVFNGTTEEERWNPAEDDNVLDKDMGAVKGTNVKDLCDLVGGASPGDEIRIKANDGFYKNFAYENIYEPDPRQGALVVCWYNGEESITGEPQGTGYVPSYFYGMRLVAFADTSTNPWGHHVFGNWDEHECMDEEYWHYYYSGSEPYPTTTGFTIKFVSEIFVYSDDEPTGSIAITSSPAGAAIALDDSDTGEVTNATIEDVELGPHTVTLTLDGYEDATGTVTVKAGKTATLHLALVSTEEGDAGEAAGPSGYRGARLETVAHGTLNGSVLVLRSTGPAAALDAGRSAAFVIPVTLPENATVSSARLSIFTSGGWEETGGGRARSADLAVKFGNVIPAEQRRYADLNASERPVAIETIAYDVTSLLKGSANYSVGIENTGPRGSRFVAEGAVLTIVCHNDALPAVSYWIAEGCDAVQADTDEGVSNDDARTVVEFSGDLSRMNGGARLVVASTAADGTSRAINRIAFNDGEWDNLLAGGTGAVALADIDVGPYLVSSMNEAFIGSVRSGDTGDYIENRYAMLVVTHRQSSSEEPGPSISTAPETATTPVAPELERVSTSTSGPLPEQSPSGNELGGGRMAEKDLFGSIVDTLWLLIAPILGLPENPHATGDSRYMAGDEPPPTTPPGLGSETAATEPTASLLQDNETAAETMAATNLSHRLSIDSNPPGALVYLDGEYIGKIAPVVLESLPIGDHTIRLEMDGYYSREETVTVPETTIVVYDLSPVGGTRPRHQSSAIADAGDVHSGGLYITSLPNTAAITIDNKLLDWRTPHVVAGLRSGEHSLQVRIDKMETDADVRQVWVYPGVLFPVDVNLIESPRIRTITVESSVYNDEQFTLDGSYPLHTVPETVEVRGAANYLAFEQGGAYISSAIPEVLEDNDIFTVESAMHRYYRLVVTSEPRGCDVFIDGYPTGRATPAAFNVSDGPHRIAVHRAGYLPEVQEIALQREPGGASDRILQFALEGYSYGYLTVNSSPAGAKIYLYGKNTGEKAPHTFPQIPIGTYDVKVVGDMATRVVEDVVVVPWDVTTVDVVLDPEVQ